MRESSALGSGDLGKSLACFAASSLRTAGEWYSIFFLLYRCVLGFAVLWLQHLILNSSHSAVPRVDSIPTEPCFLGMFACREMGLKNCKGFDHRICVVKSCENLFLIMEMLCFGIPGWIKPRLRLQLSLANQGVKKSDITEFDVTAHRQAPLFVYHYLSGYMSKGRCCSVWYL